MNNSPAPDGFPFTQEIYDRIKAAEAQMSAGGNRSRTPELNAELVRLSVYVFSDAYEKWDIARRDKEIEDRIRKVMGQ